MYSKKTGANSISSSAKIHRSYFSISISLIESILDKDPILIVLLIT